MDVDSSHSNYNESLQDLSYTYDAVGNITYITDSAQQAVFYNNSYVPPDQDYTYDSLYRLVMAGGRELKGLASVTSFGSGDNTDDRYWMNSPQPGDGTAMQNYLQKYEYDKAGNMRTLKHIANTGSYTRSFGVDHTNNRLTGSDVGIDTNAATPYSYNYDARGNMTSMPHLGVMGYDALNQMVYVEPGNDKVFYQYSGGQRIRKRIEKAGGLEIRIYLGGYEVYRKWDSAGNLTLERTTVHVGDDGGRIGMIEARTVGSDGSPALLRRFIYSNHLQSTALEVDDNGNIISYEEYHPYGTTSYQAMDATINAVAKRYRYTGKERDEESGLNYHGARYYAPWLCRWCAVDPLESKYAGMSPYNYCFGNPVNYNDNDGKSGRNNNKGISPSLLGPPTATAGSVGAGILMGSFEGAGMASVGAIAAIFIEILIVALIIAAIVYIIVNLLKRIIRDTPSTTTKPGDPEKTKPRTPDEEPNPDKPSRPNDPSESDPSKPTKPEPGKEFRPHEGERPSNEPVQEPKIKPEKVPEPSELPDDDPIVVPDPPKPPKFDEKFEILYRAVSWKEFDKRGGLLEQRTDQKDNLKGEGPYITKSLPYATKMLSDSKHAYKYDLIVMYIVPKGSYNRLLSQARDSHSFSDAAAAKLNIPLKKVESDGINPLNVNIKFPGKSADTYFNPYVIIRTPLIIKNNRP